MRQSKGVCISGEIASMGFGQGKSFTTICLGLTIGVVCLSSSCTRIVTSGLPLQTQVQNTPQNSTTPLQTTSLDFVSLGDTWKYSDKGKDFETTWMTSSFDDSSWSSGKSELGYGDGDETTVVSTSGASGGSSTKPTSMYFRKSFNVANPSDTNTLTLSLIYDDGAVVYINGTEARRVNMPLGTIHSTTLASSSTENAAETTNIDTTLLVAGTNIIAVEVHQSSANGSDLSFDLSLKGKKNTLTHSGLTYFEDDFQGVTLTLSSSGLSQALNGWSLKSNSLLADFYLTADAGYIDHQITLDPAGTQRSVLYAQSINDDPNRAGTQRAQTQIDFKATTDLSVYHTSHRVYFHPDIASLSQYGGMISARGTPDWFTVFEIWNQRDPSLDGDIGGAARWSFSIKKEAGVGMPLGWEISAELMQPEASMYNLIWPMQTNMGTPVPIGKWATIDFYLKRGMGSEGHIVVTVKPDDGDEAVIFDINDTTVYPGDPSLPLRAWQPFKLYTSDAIMDWMTGQINSASGQGKKFGAYYNDFKWFKD